MPPKANQLMLVKVGNCRRIVAMSCIWFQEDIKENSLGSGMETFCDPILRLKSADQNGNWSTNDEIMTLRSYP